MKGEEWKGEKMMQVRKAASTDLDQVFELMQELMRSPAGVGETPVV